MAVVISQAQGEDAFFAEHGYDIRPHRARIVNEDLDEKFKDPEDPLRLAFVCAMWRTGFDAPACSTIYLDRPMRNHTLMQTIARANRVFGDKVNGLIVDYIGIFRELQEALAIYATGRGAEIGEYPVKDISVLVDRLRDALAEVDAFCAERGVDRDAILAQGHSVFEHIAMVDEAIAQLVDAQTEAAVLDAIEDIIVNDALKLRFLNLVGEVERLYKAVLPDPRAGAFAARRKLLCYMADKIRGFAYVDLPDVESEVTRLLNDSITTLQPYAIREPAARYNLGEVDFEALKREFAQGRKRVEAEKLRGAIHAKIQRLVRRNRSRIDYQEEYERLIEEYDNKTSAPNVEQWFAQLLDLAQRFNAEEQRHVRENLSEEELAIFDILTARLCLGTFRRPGPDLSGAERTAIKEVARALLATLKRELLVLDWRKQQRYRAAVRVKIEDMLDAQLPARYDTELYYQKCADVYQHIYDSYAGGGESIYATG